MEPEVQEQQQTELQEEQIQQQQQDAVTQAQAEQSNRDPLDLTDEEFSNLNGDQLIQQPETEVQNNGLQEGRWQEEVVSEEPPKDINFYKSFYDQMTAPLKAVKGYVTITNTNDLRNLISKGVDYTRKTQELSKYRSTIKFLEKNDLLDDTKLSYLNDLNRFDKSAIRKLIKDASNNEEGEKIDFYDLNPSDDMTDIPEYVMQNKNTYNDMNIDAEETLDRICENKDGVEFVYHLKEMLDQNSINFALSNPQIIEDLYGLKSIGELENLEGQVANYKALYPESARGMTDLELFKTAISTNQKALEYLQSKHPSAPQQGVRYGTRSQIQQTNNAKAAAITRGTGARVGQHMVDPLDMNDEEFSKAFAKYL